MGEGGEHYGAGCLPGGKGGIAETYQLGEHEAAGHGESGTAGVEHGGTAWDVEAGYCVVTKSQNVSFLVDPLLA